MITTYTYQNKTYETLHDVAKALAQNCIFIPLSISDDNLQELGVTVNHAEEPIEQLRQQKIMELKAERDSKEVEPIAYGEHIYDYDDKARDRINAAIIALELQGEGATIEWTTADNQDVKVTAKDLRMIIASVAARSNKLHTAYRTAKAQVEVAQSKDEIDTISIN
ncbi:DUF4376 domain-containing protein [Phascolarctobacterium succinatutens]|uniref:DUF4376 domain-containing protein n=1 Tax=Phascolarctobacterium succinatutens TaxID=626940 RepID=UPI0026F21632|nr:DUF4376 domain-containing protein [Phascolarctobacterium succinatutens]